jgi:Mrp family chromosome partitioning ATPase/capsular polysaccharide biosynthesis protein
MMTARSTENTPSPSAAVKPEDPWATEVGTLGLNELKRRLGIWIGALATRRTSATLSIEELERNLKVYQERTSRIIAVSFTSTNPQRAAAVANRTVQLYVDSQYEQKRTYLSREIARLDERIAELETAAENVGASLETSIQQRGGAPHGAGSEARKGQEHLRKFLREATANGQLQDSLLRRQKEIRSEQEMFTPEVHIASLAWPPTRPSSPNPALFIFPALIISSICGAFLAVGMERLDRRLRSERDVNDALGIPCIGLVPQIRRRGRIRLHQYLLHEPPAAYGEAIRSILAAVQLAPSHRAPKVILICSSMKGEGKTTLAMSLAAYAARLEPRVLLVDLDFRHPSDTRELDGKRGTVKKDILDLFVEGAALAEFIKHIPDLGIDYLATAPCTIDPLMLFTKDRLPCLLHQLRETYDLVIVDSPPLIGITETRLLAPLVDKVLFLVKWGTTRREVAQHGLSLVLNTNAFDGGHHERPSAIVTQVNLKQHTRYRYGDVGEFLAKL